MLVKIKTWNDMEEEFGIDEEGDIMTKEYFINDMEEELPDDRIIEITKHSSNDVFYEWNNEHNTWMITNDMIEEVL